MGPPTPSVLCVKRGSIHGCRLVMAQYLHTSDLLLDFPSKPMTDCLCVSVAHAHHILLWELCTVACLHLIFAKA